MTQSAFAESISSFNNNVKKKKNLREFVLAISLISFGSNQTFFFPHRITEAASLFCNLRELKKKSYIFKVRLKYKTITKKIISHNSEIIILQLYALNIDKVYHNYSKIMLSLILLFE